MYKPFPNFQSPQEDATIWRYMDVSKYLALIINHALFFSRCDMLEDEFEGVSTKSQFEFMENFYNIKPEHKLKMSKSIRESENMWRRLSAISCWHINEFESAAMWKIYLQTGEGLVLKSSFKRLKESFDDHKEDDIYIGKVNYINYDKAFWGNLLLGNLIHKRQYFSYENELRAIIIKSPELCTDENGNYDIYKSPGLNYGINIKVDLSTLIEKVIVAPNTPEWIFNVINEVTKKYGLSYQIERSKMDSSKNDIPQ